jgi:chromatin segregation and condensation protein Rec8/ScpA/Scc1 (kleisin family)
MLVSLARRGDLEIKIDDILEATKEVLQLIAPTKKVANNAKQNELTMGEKRGIIIKHLAEKEGYEDSKMAILRRYTLKMDHEDLDRVVTFLEAAKVLLIENRGRVLYYRLNMGLEKVREYVMEYQK